MSDNLDKVIVIKIGGATLGSYDTTFEDIVNLQKQGVSLVVVHGGGKLITEWLKNQGVSTRFIRGERVTDRATLEAAISVLAGFVNKEIVAAINSIGGKAIGICGIDGALIRCEIKDAELGYVGKVIEVNLSPLKTLLQSGYIPVVAPLGLYPEGSNETPQILNINADVVAGEIAAAIGAERLIFLTDVAGICNQLGKLVHRLSPSQAEELIASGVASGGMIPKIKASLRALSTTSVASIIDGRRPQALVAELDEGNTGTTINA